MYKSFSLLNTYLRLNKEKIICYRSHEFIGPSIYLTIFLSKTFIMKLYNIVIASDHSGYTLKDKIVHHLTNQNISVNDLGTHNTDTVDYPIYAKKVVTCILEDTASLGILICGTGIGMSITANRSSGIRAALCVNLFMSERARSHNDANILVLGAKIIDEQLALEMVDKFLSTKFEGGRHSVRVSQIG
jgi:ribose 5-phosphate isomerase B